jgi:hypothetical protein
MSNKQTAPSTKAHAIDLAAVAVGEHVVQQITTDQSLKVKVEYVGRGQVEHCQAIARNAAYDGRRADQWVTSMVSDKEYYTINNDGKSITWRVKLVVARKPKAQDQS